VGDARNTQTAIDVLETPTTIAAQLTQTAIEVLATPETPTSPAEGVDVQLTQTAIEILAFVRGDPPGPGGEVPAAVEPAVATGNPGRLFFQLILDE
jgi:hypothetical protein